jgi:hypothetical protein
MQFLLFNVLVAEAAVEQEVLVQLLLLLLLTQVETAEAE